MFFHIITEHSSDYVMIVDEMGEVSYVSPAIERVMGYSPEAVIGQNAFENIHPDDMEYAANSLGKTIEQSDQEVTVQFRAEAKDGSIRWLEARGRNFLDDPLIDGIMVNVRDVTHRKQHEQRIQVLNRFLRHNLRNDLNAIRGCIELATDPDNQRVEEPLESALRTADNLLESVKTARNMQTKLAESDLRDQDLASVLRQVVDRIREEYSEQEVQVSVPDTVPIVALNCLDDALWELLENACIYGNGPIRVSVETNDQSVIVEISDQGPGIPEQEVAVLNSGEETSLEHGSGLGLWIAYWMISASQGTLSFENDDGTTTRVSLMAVQE
ncbi:MAG: PAS domain S-box protein [Halobacteriales archaeon]